MAVINFYEDIFSERSAVKEIKENLPLNNIVSEYLETMNSSVVNEVYNLETGESEYVTGEVVSYKVVALVNMEQKELEYIIQETDIINIVFIPEKVSNWVAEGMVTVGGWMNTVGGVLLGMGGWFSLAGGILCTIGAGLILWGNWSMDDEDNSGNTALDSEQNLAISGGSNQTIVGNRYPFVMGRHLMNPQVVGSAYNTTLTKDYKTAEDKGQYITQLYCLGYGPLKITNFKIGDVWCAYNQTTGEITQSDYKKRNTIMHGQLHDISNTEDDDGEILRKWKNNDLTLEILQKGDFAIDDDDRYGELYPVAVKQTDVKANILKIQDSLIEKVGQRVYKGTSIPNGFQSNSVRFSGSCPKRLEVELDFPNGLYATRTYSKDDKTKIYYYNVPTRIAIQWRYVREGQASSLATSPEGWHDFDYVDFTDGSKLYPTTYTLNKKIFDYKSALGKTNYLNPSNYDDVFNFNEGDAWVNNGRTFDFGNDSLSKYSSSTKYVIEVTEKKTDEQLFEVIDDWKLLEGPDLRDNYEDCSFAKDYNYEWVTEYDEDDEEYTVKKQYYYLYLSTDQSDIAVNYQAYGIPYGSTTGTPEWFEISNEQYNDFMKQESSYNASNPYLIPVREIESSEAATTTYTYESEEQLSQSEIEAAYMNWRLDRKIKTHHPLSYYNNEVDIRYYYDSFTYTETESSTTSCGNTDYYYTYNITANYNGGPIVQKHKAWKVKKSTTEFTYVYNSVGSITKTKYSPNDFKKYYGVNEKRFVAVKEFTEEECRQMVNFKTEKDVSLDCVEVRVIRITPQYLDQTDASGKWSNMTYQDLCKWTYLRTWSFDKDKYSNALTDAKNTRCYSPDGVNFYKDKEMTETVTIPQDVTPVLVEGNKYKYDNSRVVSVEDYPQRPQSKEDMEKFVYVALKLKQDAAENAGQSLNQLSLVVESMGPKYTGEDFVWAPEQINTTYKYYAKYTDDFGEVRIDTYDNEVEWNAVKELHKDDDWVFTKSKKGNDLVKQIKQELFAPENRIADADPVAIAQEVNNFNTWENGLLQNKGFTLNTMTGDVTDQQGIYGKVNGIVPHKFGNVDMDNRTVVYWNAENRAKFAKQLEAWSLDVEDGDYSTVLTSSDTYTTSSGLTNVDISVSAFTKDGYLLSPSDITSYINGLISKVGIEKYELLNADSKQIIIDVGENATVSGLLAHFTGQYGAICMIYANSDKSQYILPDTLRDKYVTANSSSIGVLSLVGPHLSVEAKTYDAINMASATEMYKFCEDVTDGTPDEEEDDNLKHFKFTCNGVVLQEVKLETLIQKILLTGRSNIKRDEENKYEFVIGKPIDYPVMLINQQNCLSRSNSRSFQETPSGLMVSFVDESDNWGQNDIYIMDDGEDYKNPTKETESYSFQYVTNRDQIWSLGRFNLGARIYQRETYSREVGKAGYLLSFGDKVLLQDETLVVGTDNGARIKKILEDANNIYGFIFSDLYQYTGKLNEDNLCEQGCTIMQASAKGDSRCVTLRFAVPGTSITLMSAQKFATATEFRLEATVITKDVVLRNTMVTVAKEYYEYNGKFYFFEGADFYEFEFINPSDTIVYVDSKTLIPYVTSSSGSYYNLNKVDTYKMIKGKTNIALLQYPINKNYETSEEYDDSTVGVYLKPKLDDLVAFGNVSNITLEAMITAIKPNGNEKFSLTLMPYNDEIYWMGKKIIEFKSNMTNPIREGTDVEFTNSVTQEEVNNTSTIVTANAVSSVNERVENLEAAPNVYTSITTCGVAVNDNDIVTQDQQVVIEFFVKQGARDLDFYFATESFDIPETYSYFIDGNTLTLTVPKDSVVTTDILNLPIIFTAYRLEHEYANSNEDQYSPDSSGENWYGKRSNKREEVYYDVGFTVIGVQGGRYLGAVTNVTEDNIIVSLPDSTEKTIVTNNLILGDYFTFTGTPCVSDLVKDGKNFTQGTLYEFTGKVEDRLYQWQVDNMSEHCGGTLSDALSISDAELEQNNSTVYQFLDHLTANSVFANLIATNKLLANEAIINSIFAEKIELKDGGALQSEGYETGNSKGFILRSDGTFELSGGSFYGNIESGALILIQSEEGSASIDTINNNISTYEIYTNPDWIKGKMYAVSGTINGDVVSDFIYTINSPKVNTNKRTIGYKFQSWVNPTQQKAYYCYPLIEYDTTSNFIIKYTCGDGVKSLILQIPCYYRVFSSKTTTRSNYDSDDDKGLIVDNRDATTTYYDNGENITDEINILRTSSNKVIRFNDLPTQDEIYSSTPKGTVYVDTTDSNTIKIVL